MIRALLVESEFIAPKAIVLYLPEPEWQFNLPKKNAPAAGTAFKVEIIDTWNMTITPAADTFKLAEPNDYR
jgi:hypothetical protein